MLFEPVSKIFYIQLRKCYLENEVMKDINDLTAKTLISFRRRAGRPSKMKVKVTEYNICSGAIRWHTTFCFLSSQKNRFASIFQTDLPSTVNSRAPAHAHQNFRPRQLWHFKTGHIHSRMASCATYHVLRHGTSHLTCVGKGRVTSCTSSRTTSTRRGLRRIAVISCIFLNSATFLHLFPTLFLSLLCWRINNITLHCLVVFAPICHLATYGGVMKCDGCDSVCKICIYLFRTSDYSTKKW